jgi:hypothetical protein
VQEYTVERRVKLRRGRVVHASRMICFDGRLLTRVLRSNWIAAVPAFLDSRAFQCCRLSDLASRRASPWQRLRCRAELLQNVVTCTIRP